MSEDGVPSAGAPSADANDPHAILDLLGNLIIEHHCSRIA
jgi:hypothetical protein